MTKKEMYGVIKSVMANINEGIIPTDVTIDEINEFLDKQVELLNKKSGSSRKPTKTQIENEGLKSEIVDYLTEVDKENTIKEIVVGIPSLADMSNQKVTHLLTALVNDGILVKNYVKKVPYYSINKSEDIEDSEGV